MLHIIFILPVVQLVLLVYAANLEMKEIRFYVVDMDKSAVSGQLVAKFRGSPFFRYKGSGFNLKKGEDMLAAENADLIIHIPGGFEKSLRGPGPAPLQLLINGVNSTKAGLINTYTSGIIQDFNSQLRHEWGASQKIEGYYRANLITAFWFNPELNYKIYMLPGILVILVTITGMFLTALNLVREKELGTSEQINVTPVKKYQFLFSKLFPFWVIALMELAFGLTLGYFLFDLPMEGSLALLFLFASVYLLAVLGIGLFLSAISQNQQQVMFLSFFFMLTFILMSGIFTPVESMPEWAQTVNITNPFAYFMKVIRMILLKASVFSDIKSDFISISVYALITLSLSVFAYRKVS